MLKTIDLTCHDVRKTKIEFRALCRVKDRVDGLWYNGVMVEIKRAYSRGYIRSVKDCKMKCVAFNSLGEELAAWSHNKRENKARD